MYSNQMLLRDLPEDGTAAKIDPGGRFLNVFIGGGFQATGLMMREDETIIKLVDQVKQVFVDTDPNHLELLSQDDKLVLDDVRAAALLESIKNYPDRFVGAELLGNLEHKWQALGAAESLPAGLMTRRELGLLVLQQGLWRRPTEVRNFLMRKPRELHQVHAASCWKPNHHPRKKLSLTVSEFYSVCGGTGSSLALPLEDLQRYLLNTDGGFTAVKFDAQILLPGPMLHRAIDPQALKANTWAFLLELMQRYERKLGPLHLGAYKVPRLHRPFGHVYVYDENNALEQVLTSREQINDMVKEIWKLQNLGPEGHEYHSRLVDYHLEYPNIFSSAGCHILEYPAAAIEWACALRSGADWIVEFPLKAVNPQQAQAAVKARLQDLLNQHPGFREVSRLNCDTAGKPIDINLRSLGQLPRTQVPQAVADTIHRQLADARVALERLAAYEKDQLAASTVFELQKLLNQEGGVTLADVFLQALHNMLTQQKQKLGEQVDRAISERERRETSVQQHQNPSWWQRLSLNHRGAYIKRADRMAASQLNELRQRIRLTLAEQLLEFVTQLQKECGAWRTTLENLQRQLGEALDDHWQQAERERPIAVEWVVCYDQIDQMYAEYCAMVLAQASEHLKLTWRPEQSRFMLTYATDQPTDVDRWAVASPVGIAKHAAYLQRFWQNTLDFAIEEFLAKQGKSAEGVLADLEHKAAPLIKVDDTTQIPAEKPLKILGSETVAFWRDLVGQTGLSMVATGNRHRISLLYTVHGFNPLDGLIQSQAWKQAYDDALAAGRSPHVFPEMATGTPRAFGANGHGAVAENFAMKEGGDESA